MNTQGNNQSDPDKSSDKLENQFSLPNWEKEFMINSLQPSLKQILNSIEKLSIVNSTEQFENLLNTNLQKESSTCSLDVIENLKMKYQTTVRPILEIFNKLKNLNMNEHEMNMEEIIQIQMQKIKEQDIVIQSKDTQNEILKQQLQMYKEQKDLMRQKIEVLEQKQQCVLFVENLGLYFEQKKQTKSQLKNQPINKLCSFQNIPEDNFEVIHSINSVQEDLEKEFDKHDFQMKEITVDNDEIMGEGTGLDFEDFSTPQFEMNKQNQLLEEYFQKKSYFNQNYEKNVCDFDNLDFIEQDNFVQETPKKNKQDDIHSSQKKNLNLSLQDTIQKQQYQRLKELEKMDVICSIDQGQEEIKQKVQEAYLENKDLFIQFFKVPESTIPQLDQMFIKKEEQYIDPKENSITKGNLISFSNIDQVTEVDIYGSNNIQKIFKHSNSDENQSPKIKRTSNDQEFKENQIRKLKPSKSNYDLTPVLRQDGFYKQKKNRSLSVKEKTKETDESGRESLEERPEKIINKKQKQENCLLSPKYESEKNTIKTNLIPNDKKDYFQILLGKTQKNFKGKSIKGKSFVKNTFIEQKKLKTPITKLKENCQHQKYQNLLQEHPKQSFKSTKSFQIEKIKIKPKTPIKKPKQQKKIPMKVLQTEIVDKSIKGISKKNVLSQKNLTVNLNNNLKSQLIDKTKVLGHSPYSRSNKIIF